MDLQDTKFYFPCAVQIRHIYMFMYCCYAYWTWKSLFKNIIKFYIFIRKFHSDTIIWNVSPFFGEVKFLHYFARIKLSKKFPFLLFCSRMTYCTIYIKFVMNSPKPTLFIGFRCGTIKPMVSGRGPDFVCL